MPIDAPLQIYPFASAIDTPLPKAEKTLSIMRDSCPEYIPVPEASVVLPKYNEEGIEQWHKSHGAWYFIYMQLKALALVSRSGHKPIVCLHLQSNHQLWRKRNSYQSSSAKLFADAEAEERDFSNIHRPSRADIIRQKEENWDGEERIQDAVLRMLVDKYKPLRTGQIQTADEKLKHNIPRVLTKITTQEWGSENGLESRQSTDMSHYTASTYEAPAPGPDQLSSTEPVPPWLVTFKVPSHAQASIKFGNFISTPPRLVTSSTSDPLQKPVRLDPLSTRTRAKQKAEKRFAQVAGRIDRARESIIDYRSGVHGQETGSRPNPVSIRGWNALIEERIQKAQATGMFDRIEGRGKPLRRTVDEMNPFVAREEFLMNRIVLKNDAAPPWVELQKEAEKATVQFRELLISGWTRRVTRMLPLSNPTSKLASLTPELASKLRDSEWEQQEAKFHEAAIRDTNEAIRRYNAVAPYIVRRPLLTLQSELAKCYADAAKGIVISIQARLAENEYAGNPESTSLASSEFSHPTGWGLGVLLSNAMKRAYTRLFGRMY
ncbi:hypothetical protein RhiXN_04069 [Rhizoctonia solani]|uniref:DnaJ homologue subfamily C member 28 conserved domain-containing protein n=1 Tax=Rhizoctonia solani TaxID=456999 RepID=A0A8H8NP21_9AGAM|nr:uncharacterized protein RhiXN_04069 [Rhizoctonia solani]QRW16068.1 hypothetical protein RhiXN_04069 [Rhizoctonia solani]